MVKTADGNFSLNYLVGLLKKLDNISVRKGGGNHPYVMVSELNPMHPCPISGSTHVKTQLVPWLRYALGLVGKITNYEVYEALKDGNLSVFYENDSTEE